LFGFDELFAKMTRNYGTAKKAKTAKRPVGRPRSPVPKVSVLIYLPTEADRLLEYWSTKLKVSKSAIVEKALERHGTEIIRSLAYRDARQKVNHSLATCRRRLANLPESSNRVDHRRQS
jgi:hypothetical protein